MYIQTFKDAAKLSMADGASYGLSMPKTVERTGMKVFYSATTGEDVDWVASIAYADQVSTNDSAYLMSVSKMGWIGNQDYNAIASSNSGITFRSDSIPLSAMKLYVILEEENAVYEVMDSVSQAFSTGDTVKVLAFAVDAGGTYYQVLEDVEVSQNLKHSLNFTKTNANDLADVIKGL